MNKNYLFSLGAVPMLSEAEIRSVFPLASNIERTGTYLTLTLPEAVSVKEYMPRFGGTISIAQEISEGNIGDPVTYIASYLEETIPEGKIHFGVSGISQKGALQVKKLLKSQGRSVRYIEIKNSATIIHNNLMQKQSHIVAHDNRLYVTVALHDFENMAERDEDRPAVDSRSGMLPPKLARMMLNIAGLKQTDPMLDPFCGSGTVLMEAALIGMQNLTGTDMSQKAIDDTKKNMDWLMNVRGISVAQLDLVKHPVESLAEKLPKNAFAGVVTEPYMGAPKRGKETVDTILQEIKELQALYDQAFASIVRLVKPGGTIVFSKPRFFCNNTWHSIEWNHILKKHGLVVSPLLPDQDHYVYAREGQIVGREIWKLKNNK